MGKKKKEKKTAKLLYINDSWWLPMTNLYTYIYIFHYYYYYFFFSWIWTERSQVCIPQEKEEEGDLK